MKNYRFLIKHSSGVELSFLVAANSREEAVLIANEDFSEPEESRHLHLGSHVQQAYLYLNADFQVDERMIFDESPANQAFLVETVYEYLTQQGYDYSSQKEDLWNDEEPSFTKTIQTINGEIYGFYTVRALYDLNIRDYDFSIRAFIYPLARANIARGEGGIAYAVEFVDKQVYLTFEHLPKALELYEGKFSKLIQSLREADPIDGLPL